jgi:GTP cyclohydrolase FolE2
MSRLVECLGIYKDEVIDKHDELLNRLADSHEVDNSYWECSWDSMHSFEGDYEVRIKCNLEGVKHKNKIQWYITVVVPYASVCPCAHEMVREHGGVPHMQRATATITGLVDENDSLHDLIAMTVNKVSNAVDLVPIALMKRKDELEWCQRAGETNLFVEGAAREIARSIEGWYADYVVVCRHEETIHQHDVVAVYRKGETLI